MGGVSPETCWGSYKYEINFDTLLDLVGFLYELYYDARIREHKKVTLSYQNIANTATRPLYIVLSQFHPPPLPSSVLFFLKFLFLVLRLFLACQNNSFSRNFRPALCMNLFSSFLVAWQNHCALLNIIVQINKWPHVQITRFLITQ